MDKIKSVAVVGGTHGNELTGIHLIKKWEKQPELINRSTFNTNILFSNPKAFEKRCRYIDIDLNRQFKTTGLNNPDLINYEQSRAKAINSQLGPKGDAKTDFIIDLHNTTSNMGPCLLLLGKNEFYRKMGAYVKHRMPHAVIIIQDFAAPEDYAFLISIAKYGVTIEMGSQPHGVLRQDILTYMEEMTGYILDYIEHVNNNTMPDLPSDYEAFYYTETIKIPVDDKGNRIGVVHKEVEGKDFQPLSPGDPIVSLFDGGELGWQGDYTAYPFFVNEAAYYEENIAMALSKKITVEI